MNITAVNCRGLNKEFSRIELRRGELQLELNLLDIEVAAKRGWDSAIVFAGHTKERVYTVMKGLEALGFDVSGTTVEESGLCYTKWYDGKNRHGFVTVKW